MDTCAACFSCGLAHQDVVDEHVQIRGMHSVDDVITVALCGPCVDGPLWQHCSQCQQVISTQSVEDPSSMVIDTMCLVCEERRTCVACLRQFPLSNVMHTNVQLLANDGSTTLHNRTLCTDCGHTSGTYIPCGMMFCESMVLNPRPEDKRTAEQRPQNPICSRCALASSTPHPTCAQCHAHNHQLCAYEVPMNHHHLQNPIPFELINGVLCLPDTRYLCATCVSDPQIYMTCINKCCPNLRSTKHDLPMYMLDEEKLCLVCRVVCVCQLCGLKYGVKSATSGQIDGLLPLTHITTRNDHLCTSCMLTRSCYYCHSLTLSASACYRCTHVVCRKCRYTQQHVGTACLGCVDHRTFPSLQIESEDHPEHQRAFKRHRKTDAGEHLQDF
jgi:hypothetical protein